MPETKSELDQPGEDESRNSQIEFVAGYRDRSIYFFSQCVNEFSSLQEMQDEENEKYYFHIGLKVMSCFVDLSHAIEMLCKESLSSISPFLVLRKIDTFNKVENLDPPPDEETCTCIEALGRAFKIFRGNISLEEINTLRGVVYVRNSVVHRDFSIKKIELQIQNILFAMNVFVQVYNKQFDEGDLLLEIVSLVDEENIERYSAAQIENSTTFKEVLKEFERLKEQNETFVFCDRCNYQFGHVTEDIYHCIWCKDAGEKRKCSVPSCGVEFWVSKDSVTVECGNFHWPSVKIQKWSDLLNMSGSANLNWPWKPVIPGASENDSDFAPDISLKPILKFPVNDDDSK